MRERAREALLRFAEAAPHVPHAAALTVALEDLLSDVEGRRPPSRMSLQQRLVERVARARRQIQERRPPAAPRLRKQGLSRGRGS